MKKKTERKQREMLNERFKDRKDGNSADVGLMNENDKKIIFYCYKRDKDYCTESCGNNCVDCPAN